MTIKLRVEKIFKIFGNRSNEAFALLERGESKEAIF